LERQSTLDQAPQQTPNLPICARPTAASHSSVLAPDSAVWSNRLICAPASGTAG
jgi:hypothetical protein